MFSFVVMFRYALSFVHGKEAEISPNISANDTSFNAKRPSSVKSIAASSAMFSLKFFWFAGAVPVLGGADL